MNFFKGNLPGLIICEPKIIRDQRGFFLESFRKDLFENFSGFKIDFCQENISESNYGVLRGLHFQKKPFTQSKLISVQKGKILDVVVDIRKNSKFYGKSFSIELDDQSHKLLFVPKGFAHGFIVISKTAKVCYKTDIYYNPNSEDRINYDDPLLQIDWKVDKKLIITNEKDKKNSPFSSNIFY